MPPTRAPFSLPANCSAACTPCSLFCDQRPGRSHQAHRASSFLPASCKGQAKPSWQPGPSLPPSAPAAGASLLPRECPRSTEPHSAPLCGPVRSCRGTPSAHLAPAVFARPSPSQQDPPGRGQDLNFGSPSSQRPCPALFWESAFSTAVATVI